MTLDHAGPLAGDPEAKQAGIVDCVRQALPLADFIEINESCPNVHHDTGAAVQHLSEVLGRNPVHGCRRIILAARLPQQHTLALQNQVLRCPRDDWWQRLRLQVAARTWRCSSDLRV